MKQRRIITSIGVFSAGLLLLPMVAFTVHEGEVAVVTSFGKIERAIAEAGLYFRWPWPTQKVHRYDNRLHLLSGTLEQSMMKDGQHILTAVYAGWQIAAPIRFFEGLGSIESAERHLDGLIRSYKNTALGRYSFSSLVNVDPGKLKFEEMEQAVFDWVGPEALRRYGINVGFVGFRKIGLPPDITKKVFERMRAEREAISERYISEGKGEAIKIRAQAESERDQILAEAKATAKRIRGDGDAAAAEYYQVFQENPELAIFLKKLEVLEETLTSKTTIILGTDTEPFDLLRGITKFPTSLPTP